jgi:type IV secretory pathway VirB2 component (pilin)
MKGLLKNLGLILVLIAVIILGVSAMNGDLSSNAPLAWSAILLVVGLVTYIVTNKYVTD